MDNHNEVIVKNILASRKYRNLGIPAGTVRDLLRREMERLCSLKDAEKEVRRKLHNIVASYLGDPDYKHFRAELEQAYTMGDVEAVKMLCRPILSAHASTRERMSLLEEFYPRLFEVTGKPHTILDLACGLNPFTFPWMGLDRSLQYFVYDLNQPRLDFIHFFFKQMGMQMLGGAEDILLHPPTVVADVAFFFKEAHRFEQRQKGCNLPFWQALRVKWLLVSLPTSSLSGRHDLLQKHRRMVHRIIVGQPWQITEVVFSGEIVFCIRKVWENDP
jgi:16S rRNA (guanine(1405)-N(7))-methyltransferase